MALGTLDTRGTWRGRRCSWESGLLVRGLVGGSSRGRGEVAVAVVVVVVVVVVIIAVLG